MDHSKENEILAQLKELREEVAILSNQVGELRNPPKPTLDDPIGQRMLRLATGQDTD